MPRYLIHSRAAPGAADEDDPRLDERHWRYMDGYADGMGLRGPTLAEDGATWTGSVHVVDLAGPGEAHAFVADEPYEGAGLYQSHTVWEVDVLAEPAPAGRVHGRRYLVIASGAGAEDEDPELTGALSDGLVLLARLRDVGTGDRGWALAVHGSSREVVEQWVGDVSSLTGCTRVEVHHWEPGGRR